MGDPWTWIGPVGVFWHDAGVIFLNRRCVIIAEWRFPK